MDWPWTIGPEKTKDDGLGARGSRQSTKMTGTISDWPVRDMAGMAWTGVGKEPLPCQLLKRMRASGYEMWQLRVA